MADLGKAAYELAKSKWNGKSWSLLGDSITWYDGQVYLVGPPTVCIGYPSVVKKALGIKTLSNHGISGASMARSSSYPTNACIRLAAQDNSWYTSADFVTILAGTNDFKLNVPIGTQGVIGDTTFDDTTFYGAYRAAIEYILNLVPTMKIYLFTPLQRDNGSYDVNTTNSAGAKLIDYVNAIKNIGQMYGIPVLDLYSVSGITKKNLTNFTIDGLHPNDAGHARIGDTARHFIELY